MVDINEGAFSEEEELPEIGEEVGSEELEADTPSNDGKSNNDLRSHAAEVAGMVKNLFALDKSESVDAVKRKPVVKKSLPAVKKKAPKMADISTGEEVVEEQKKYQGEPLLTVVVRNRFYRDGFRNLVRIAIVEAVIIVLLIISFVSYMTVSRPQDRYFATTADGRIMKLVPLDLANMSTSSLMSWVAQATTEVMTFGFHDYQTRFQKSARHFTRHGWEGFTNALQKSKIVESVIASSQVVTAKPKSAPILIQEGVFGGKYRWVVDLPLQVSYKSGATSRVDNLMVRLVIDRVTSLENPYGVGIEQWIAQASN